MGENILKNMNKDGNPLSSKPIFKNNKFFNDNEVCDNNLYKYLYLIKSFLHEIYIFLKSAINWNNRLPKDSNVWLEQNKSIVQKSLTPQITWIGHSTFLIQIGGVNILTDPIFGNATIFFPRIFRPAIELKDLPKIDYVLISHNHLDHMDSYSLLELNRMFPEIKFLVPFGDKKWFTKRNIENAIEFYWWQDFNFNGYNKILNEINFTFLPAYHWSQRGLFDNNKSLWGSWMIEYNNFFIYFAGDTAYSKHFSHISNKFPKIDVALMPIGPCEPKDKMCHSHIDAQEAVKSFIDLKAINFIPMHWGTFYFGTDFFITPIERLKISWHENLKNLNDKNLNIVRFGQKVEFVFEDYQKILDQNLKNPSI